ncbi:MAG TPA: hypothetical protein VFR24_22120 [Candidatus Angelobacter sp.]|nr:hypothetical protein [Candidatus Angelobacter sp.]
MTVSTLLSIVAVSLSIVSLIFTAYQQYFKRPSIAVLLTSQLRVCYEHDERLYLYLDVLLRNKGAQYACIRAVQGRLYEKKARSILRSTAFSWLAFMKHTNVGNLGEGYRPVTAVEELAGFLVIPGRSAITKMIQFITVDKFKLTPGEYDLQLYIFEGQRKYAVAETSKQFRMSDEIAAGVLYTDKETHLVKKLTIVPFNLEI